MLERVIYISSINRQKIGKNRPDNFIIKFNPSLKLDSNMKNEIGVCRISMTYSWENITLNYKNNTIKYSTDSGNTWETVIFVDGMYSYSDINDYLHQYMDKKNHKTGDIYHINITFILSTYRVIIEIDNNYKFNLENSNLGDLIGFDKKIINETEYGVNLPNITNSIDTININTNMVSDSIVNGVNSNTIFVIPTENLTRSYPFTVEPKKILYNNIASLNISKMSFYLTDSIERPIDLNGIDWYLTLIIRSTPK